MYKKVGILFRDLQKVGPYERALEAVDLEPVRITPDDPKPLDGLDGLLCAGGADVNPELYGEDPHPETGEADDARDQLESRLLRQALDADLPVLAICRGMQLFNVVRGGTLHQHLETTGIHRQPGVPNAHAIEVLPGTRLEAILGAAEHTVNSRHHQAVKDLGRDLVVSAKAGDVVEAIELPGKTFALGVQWHPEDTADENPGDRRLFESFRDAMKP